uniref:Uncharacterized protein n=1 Tax=Leersia perrieri TaxID=77586 RepID=A0A0D9WJI7_9ORYZ
MGNSLPLPCPCKEGTAVATSGVKKRRKRMIAPVREEEEMKSAWPGCHVEASGGDGVRVKVVMKRKDAAELMARLEERCALERKARMVQLNSGLGGGGVMSPCRDAWAPRLASIAES